MSWPKPQLQEFCRIIQGGRSGLSGNDFVPEGIPAYGAGGLNGYLPSHEFDEPAVILSSIDARCGKCFYAEGKWASLANTQLIFPDTTKADVRFLWIQLNDESRWHRSGTGQPFIKPSDVKAHRVLLPPLAEQRRIAEVLDRAEALRAKRRAALAQLDSLTQSLFLDLFGDPLTNPKNWPTVRFEEICARVTVGIVVKPASYYVSEGVPALRSLNIKPGKIVLRDLVYFSKSDNETKLTKTKLKAGDLVLVRSGQPGTAAVVPRELDGVNAIDLLIATPLPKLVDAPFLCEFFNSAGGRDLVLSRQRGQVQKHLNVGCLNEAVIPLPPITLQREFARRVTAVEALKTAQRASLAELDALFATLQHRAFKGEL